MAEQPVIPDAVFFELTTACNMRCPSCPITKVTRRGMLDCADIERSLQELCALGFAGTVNFHVMGEPLLHPEHRAIFALARRYASRLELTTNGILLDAGKAYLAESITSLWVSVMHRDLQRRTGAAGRQWSEYVATLAEFLRALPADSTMQVMLRIVGKRNLLTRCMTLDADGAHIVEEIAVAAGVPVTWPEGADAAGTMRVANNLQVNLYELINWNLGPKRFQPAFGQCPIWPQTKQVTVLADGTVGLCCLDYAGGTAIGSIHNSSWAELLSSAALREQLAGFERWRLARPVCRSCRGSDSPAHFCLRKGNDLLRAAGRAWRERS